MRQLMWIVACSLAWLSVGGSEFSSVVQADQHNNALSAAEAAGHWRLLFDGRTLNGWAPRGDAIWTVEDGSITANKQPGRGYLATTESFANFELKIDFWMDSVFNSGVFLRSPVEGTINHNTGSEINILDGHAEWPTASHVLYAKAPAVPSTVGKWSTFEIVADGAHFVTKLNGRTTADARDERFTRGPIALQYGGAGQVKFRNIRIRPLD